MRKKEESNSPAEVCGANFLRWACEHQGGEDNGRETLRMRVGVEEVWKTINAG